MRALWVHVAGDNWPAAASREVLASHFDGRIWHLLLENAHGRLV